MTLSLVWSVNIGMNVKSKLFHTLPRAHNKWCVWTKITILFEQYSLMKLLEAERFWIIIVHSSVGHTISKIDQSTVFTFVFVCSTMILNHGWLQSKLILQTIHSFFTCTAQRSIHKTDLCIIMCVALPIRCAL